MAWGARMSSCAFAAFHLQRLERAPELLQEPQMGAEPTREERLAAKLRENLRRRKVQARALSANGEIGTDAPLSNADEDS